MARQGAIFYALSTADYCVEYTFRDQDGHRIVLMLAGWDSKSILEVSQEMKKLSAGGGSGYKGKRDAVTEV